MAVCRRFELRTSCSGDRCSTHPNSPLPKTKLPLWAVWLFLSPKAPHTGPGEPSSIPPSQGLTAVLLVRLVLAVGRTVTDPAAMDTLTTATVELEGGAGAADRLSGRVSAPAVLRPLIGAIVTVPVPVAGPQAGDARRGVAAEVSRTTSGGRTVGLVRAVQAIPVLVTHKLPGDALAILAAELVQGARLGGCGGCTGRRAPCHATAHTTTHQPYSQTGPCASKKHGGSRQRPRLQFLLSMPPSSPSLPDPPFSVSH